uniref:Transposase n=1 Tax=Ascaris lumbricoides TaxID=6252 RepID=A0A0M3HMY5_ASCLU
MGIGGASNDSRKGPDCSTRWPGEGFRHTDGGLQQPRCVVSSLGSAKNNVLSGVVLFRIGMRWQGSPTLVDFRTASGWLQRPLQ